MIAGDVNILSPVSPYINYNAMPVMMYDKAPTGIPPSFSEKSFADYHMYTLSEPVTLNDFSQKQVEFIPKVYNISIKKYHTVTINAGGYT